MFLFPFKKKEKLIWIFVTKYDLGLCNYYYKNNLLFELCAYQFLFYNVYITNVLFDEIYYYFIRINRGF